MTLSPLHLYLVCGERIHLIALWLSLLSTCIWCVVSAYSWLALWLSLLSTCSWCVVSAYSWLALWLSLLSTCSWCVVSVYTWLLYDSLSSPPVAGVWWAHWSHCPVAVVESSSMLNCLLFLTNIFHCKLYFVTLCTKESGSESQIILFY